MADQEPQDVFAEIPSEEPAPQAASSGKPELLHFDEVSTLLTTAETYIDETRADLETPGAPEAWIEDLTKAILAAKQQLQLLEVDTADDPVQWTDEFGVKHDVMMREQNKRGFDKFVKEFTKVEVGFDAYFKRHIAHLKAQA